MWCRRCGPSLRAQVKVESAAGSERQRDHEDEVKDRHATTSTSTAERYRLPGVLER